jgi:hypothetical protein
MVQIRKRKDQDGYYHLYFTYNHRHYVIHTRTTQLIVVKDIKSEVEYAISDHSFKRKVQGDRWLFIFHWPVGEECIRTGILSHWVYVESRICKKVKSCSKKRNRV